MTERCNEFSYSGANLAQSVAKSTTLPVRGPRFQPCGLGYNVQMLAVWRPLSFHLTKAGASCLASDLPPTLCEGQRPRGRSGCRDGPLEGQKVSAEVEIVGPVSFSIAQLRLAHTEILVLRVSEPSRNFRLRGVFVFVYLVWV